METIDDVIQRSEITERVVGPTSDLTPYGGFTTSQRQVMFANQAAQAVVLMNGETNSILTLTEKEYAKYVFNNKADDDGHVIAVIDKYLPSLIGKQDNPRRVVIFETYHNGNVILDVMDMELYHSKHKSFGYKKIKTPLWDRLHAGFSFRKDDIFLESPNVKDGIYGLGLNVNIVAAGIHEIIEDGSIISQSFAERAAYRRCEKATFSLGGDWVLLNLYGDENNYKPHPAIGDKIRPDGLIAAARRIEPDLSAVYYSSKALMEVDYVNDKLYIAAPDSIVYDIDVLHNHKKVQSPTLSGTDVLLETYHKANLSFYSKIIENYEERIKKYRHSDTSYDLSNEFRVMLSRAYDFVNHEGGKFVYKRDKLEDYRVTLYLQKVVPLRIGDKLTGCHGDGN